jgi:hypothetical protein
MAIARPPDLEHGGGLLGPVMSRRRTTTLLLLAFNVVCIFIVVHLGGAAISTLRPPFAASSVQPETDDDPCAGFNPHADPTTDPVDCLRARQWRQIERFRALPNMT